MSVTDPASVVAALVGRIANMAPPDPDADIYTAGLASTDALELLVELEEQFGVTIPDDMFIAARTSTALGEMVNTLRGGAS